MLRSWYSTAASTLGDTAQLLRVKLQRGLIGLPQRYKDHARALGLRRTHQKVYVHATRTNLGNVLRLKELVQVKPVKGPPAPKARYWAKGYQVISRQFE